MTDFELEGKYDYCVHHHPCLDGFAAFTVVNQWQPGIAGIPMEYDEDLPFEETLRPKSRVLFVDFSLPRNRMDKLVGAGHEVTVLDHHKTSEEVLGPMLEAGMIKGVFDKNRSGARLAWDCCFPNEDLPRLVAAVEDRDLWRFNRLDTKRLTAYIGLQPFDLEKWMRMLWAFANVNDRPTDALVNAVLTGELVMGATTRLVSDMIDHHAYETRFAVPGTPSSYYVPVLNCPHHLASEAGHLMLEDFPTAAFSITYFDSNDYRKFSLRSEDERVDVEEIARAFGGGGHRNAAGFKTQHLDGLVGARL